MCVFFSLYERIERCLFISSFVSKPCLAVQLVLQLLGTPKRQHQQRQRRAKHPCIVIEFLLHKHWKKHLRKRWIEAVGTSGLPESASCCMAHSTYLPLVALRKKKKERIKANGEKLRV
jgi:hypothetical protein